MSDSAAPAWPIEGRLRRLLERRGAGEVERLAAWFQSEARRGVLVSSERVSDRPQRRSWLAERLGRDAPSATLPALSSKLGGRPYLERASEWPEGYAFLGQINLAELETPLAPLPDHGLFSIYVARDLGQPMPLLVRWYDEPREHRAIPLAPGARHYARYESRLRFESAWFPPETERGSPFPSPEDDELGDAVLEWTSAFARAQGDREGCHALLPAMPASLCDHYPPSELAELTVLMRLDRDPSADISWGSFFPHLLVPNDELRRGGLSQVIAVVTAY